MPRLTAFLAPRFLENELVAELDLSGIRTVSRHDRLFLCEDVPAAADILWADDAWDDVRSLPAESINAAAAQLRSLATPLAHWSTCCHRRGELIRQKIRSVEPKRLAFLQSLPEHNPGVYTMLSEKRMLASTSCRSRVPFGQAEFLENRTDPPSRAYLKLWELLTLHGVLPRPGDRVLDLGAAPGGWTWVLAGLGCHVTAVDKAPLAAGLMHHPRVEHLQESAFALEPAVAGDFDWVFSDIICYPDRLLQLVERWLDSGRAKNIVCTLKFQGATDREAINRFQTLPGARLVHLYHNKHELTGVIQARPPVP